MTFCPWVVQTKCIITICKNVNQEQRSVWFQEIKKADKSRDTASLNQGLKQFKAIGVLCLTSVLIESACRESRSSGPRRLWTDSRAAPAHFISNIFLLLLFFGVKWKYLQIFKNNIHFMGIFSFLKWKLCCHGAADFANFFGIELLKK